MTEQEAMGYLQTLANRIPLKFYTDKGLQIYDDFSRVVIKALERQIPKTPIDKIMYKECPVCGAVDLGRYCMECGQAIKWE